MNIVLITQQFPYGVGEQFLETELPLLAQNAKRVEIIPYSGIPGTKRIVPKNVYVHTDVESHIQEKIQALPSSLPLTGMERWTRDFCALTHAIADTIEECILLQDTDVLYSYWLTESAYAAVLLKKKYPHLHAISRGHGYDVFSERQNSDHRPYQKETIEGLDAVYAVCKAGASYMKKKYPSVQENVTDRYLGVTNQDFQKGSSDGIVRIVSCATLKPLKRIHRIAEALQYVSRPVQWVHIGDGPEMDRIRTIADILPSHIQCTFLGACTNSAVHAYYQSHPVDAFINCSETEALPVSIMEAMSYGIPCIGTDVGGVSEIIHQENGWLLHKDFHTDDLVETIERIDLSNEEKRKSAQQTQRNLCNAEKNYSNFVSEMYI